MPINAQLDSQEHISNFKESDAEIQALSLKKNAFETTHMLNA